MKHFLAPACSGLTLARLGEQEKLRTLAANYSDFSTRRVLLR
jgi:hypothetical protein